MRCVTNLGGNKSNFLIPPVDRYRGASCCEASRMAEAFSVPLAIDCPRCDSAGSTCGTMLDGRRYAIAMHPVSASSGCGTTSGNRGEAVFRLERLRWPRGLLEDAWLTAPASEMVSVRDRTLFLSTPLDRLSGSTAAAGTAEFLASHSGAELAATEGWRLPAGIGAGALQCLAMWPGCWQRWQRTGPPLRRLLGHLSSLCSLSSRWSRLFDIFSSCSKMSFVSESCVAPGADLIVDPGIIGLPFHSKWPMVSLTPCIFAQTASIYGTAGQSSGHLRQGANWVYMCLEPCLILPTTPRVRWWGRWHAQKVLDSLFDTKSV